MPGRPPYSASASPATTGAIRSCGQSCAYCHQSVGAAISAPIPTPTQQWTRQQITWAKHGHRRQKYQAQQQHLKLRHGRDPGDGTDGHQKSVVTHLDPAHQQPDQQQPLHRLERVGGWARRLDGPMGAGDEQFQNLCDVAHLAF